VVTGGTCASDEPGEGTPKCVSSAKRASMTKKERLSAARRKKKADPNQQSKTGAAKPTYVKTDSPRKKKKVSEETISEAGARVGRKFSMGKVGKQYGRDEYGDLIKKDGSSALKKNVDKNPKDDKTPNNLMGEAKDLSGNFDKGKNLSR